MVTKNVIVKVRIDNVTVIKLHELNDDVVDVRIDRQREDVSWDISLVSD